MSLLGPNLNCFIWQCAVLSMLGGLSGAQNATTATSSVFFNAKLQLKKLLVSLNLFFSFPSFPLQGQLLM